jgi:RsiW-degrading membrane proteinase PrsW (M82 family)
VPTTRAVARTEILLIGALIALVALAYLLERAVLPDGPVHLGDLPSLVLCAVPALIWLGYFYVQDRHEPEPKEYVFAVYLLGAFVAWPLAHFVVSLWPASSFAGGPLSPRSVFAAIVPGGIAQELAKFLVVRYSVYMSDEFDEPMDGIVYMTAAGIGFATAENWHAVGAAGGTIFLTVGTVNVVVATLAHGCFAGVLGYALGIARWSAAARRGPIILIGLFIAATLNGVFSLVDDQVRTAGMTVQPWRSVAFAAVFAAAVFAVTFALMRRHLAASPLAPTESPCESTND